MWKKVSMMDSTHAIHQRYPHSPVCLEVSKLVRVDNISEIARDHENSRKSGSHKMMRASVDYGSLTSLSPKSSLSAIPNKADGDATKKNGALLQLAIGTVQTRYLDTRRLESRGFPAFLGLTFD
jgi:hypothetical protein